MNEVIEVSESAPICTCGNDLSRNGGRIHNYLCPLTPKCQHPVSRINIQTGEVEQGPCGSRLEPEYACHGTGCPLVALCPHCGTRMDRRGVHNHDCPNNPYLRDRLIDPENHNYFERIMRFYLENTLPKPLPSIVDGSFDVFDDCSVCLSKFEDSQVVMKPSECQHCFHDHCMMQWLESSNKNNRKCPLCREKIETIEQQVFQNGK
jgi:hypothetical protein